MALHHFPSEGREKKMGPKVFILFSLAFFSPFTFGDNHGDSPQPRHPLAEENYGDKWLRNDCGSTSLSVSGDGHVFFYAHHGQRSLPQGDFLFCFNGRDACLKNKRWRRGSDEQSPSGDTASVQPFDFADRSGTLMTITRQMPDGEFCFNTVKISRQGNDYALEAVADPTLSTPQRDTDPGIFADPYGFLGFLMRLRAQFGLYNPLSYDPNLNLSAEQNSVLQAEGGSYVGQHLYRHDVFENATPASSYEQAVELFLNSPHHLENFLSPYISRIGWSGVQSTNGLSYWTFDAL
jgi:hypothetical protein